MFSEAGIPVWDADASVHGLYGPGGEGARAISKIAPDAVDATGVNRAKLRAAIIEDPGLLVGIETIIHPLVAQDRGTFLYNAEQEDEPLVLCDIPLLFETGAEEWLDKVVVVTAPPEVQRARVLQRPGMTAAAFEAILAKQVSDLVKREKADYLIDTSLGLEHARTRVAEIIADLTENANA
jgi:dephospho-CoA kinase